MKIAPYVEKLNASKTFQNFKTQHANSFLVAGFFVLDLESGVNTHQIDYYLPNERKVAAFTLDEQIKLQILETLKQKSKPNPLDIKTKIDLDELVGIIKDEMHNRGMTEDVKKIIAIIQNVDGKKVWDVSCVLSGMEILKSHIEDESKTVLKMERISMLDIMKKLPKEALQMMGDKKGSPKSKKDKISKKDAKEEVKNLDNLKEEIEREKNELMEASQKADAD